MRIKPPAPTKICTGCGEELPATPEFFARQTRVVNGLAARCKACCALYRHRYLDKDADRTIGKPLPREPKAGVVREKTKHGTTIIRFGEGWRPGQGMRPAVDFTCIQSSLK